MKQSEDMRRQLHALFVPVRSFIPMNLPAFIKAAICTRTVVPYIMHATRVYMMELKNHPDPKKNAIRARSP
jgi:hypothetical protein